MLSVSNLKVRYGNIEALHGVSFDVKRGEIVTLIGANGAGKTTLLTAVSGLIRPTGGTILFSGKDITRAAPDAVVSQGLCHVPERRLVFKPLSVADNLLLGSYTRRGRASRAELDRDGKAQRVMVKIGQRRGAAAGRRPAGAAGAEVPRRRRGGRLDRPCSSSF